MTGHLKRKTSFAASRGTRRGTHEALAALDDDDIIRFEPRDRHRYPFSAVRTPFRVRFRALYNFLSTLAHAFRSAAHVSDPGRGNF